VNVQSAVVLDEALVCGTVFMEEVDSGARGANDFGQHLLADLGNHRLRFAFFPEVRQQEQHADRQPLFTGVEKLVYQSSSMRMLRESRYPQEQFRKDRLLLEHLDHFGFLQRAATQSVIGRSRRHALDLPARQPSPKKSRPPKWR